MIVSVRANESALKKDPADMLYTITGHEQWTELTAHDVSVDMTSNAMVASENSALCLVCTHHQLITLTDHKGRCDCQMQEYRQTCAHRLVGIHQAGLLRNTLLGEK